MTFITRDTDYAARAIAYMASLKRELISSADVEKATKIPRPFLRKILRGLEKNGILGSIRGNKGGFKLLRAPEQIILTDLMKIFQEGINFTDCLFKKKICPNVDICPMRKRIKKIEKMVIHELESINIKSLLN